MEKQTRPKIDEKFQKNFHTHTCDVSDEQSVKDAFAWIEEKFGGVDVLINNAGMMQMSDLTAADNSTIVKNTVSTNILGVVWCTRETVRSMEQRKFNGHIVNVSSIVGHFIPRMTGYNLNIYPPTKHAIKAMTEVLRQELLAKETKIKISSVSPGAVRTEFLGEGVELPENTPALKPEEVADAIVYCIQTPPTVQIHDMIINPVGATY
ncbi:farnesol dehydrogenase [Musca domestica]|uniref:Farnesol dehydrogenase n=1 Tax=Musca domestica TaxID=7370 RepID=A0A9J7DKB8_MUSDO|nr:farnesol dehydrogenase [Musca domestica]